MKQKITMMVLMVISVFVQGAELTLQNYLDLVKNKNESYQGATAQVKSAEGLVREADLVYMPELFMEARTGYDQKQQRPTAMTFDKTNSSAYAVGLTQDTSIGLKAKLSYSISDNEIVGANPSLGVDNRFTDGAAQLELSMPLWGNGFGRKTRMNVEVTRQQSEANRQNATAQASNILVGAETAYWRLSAAVEQLKIEEQTLKAAQNILSYVNDKKRKDLGEAADVLQAQALVEAYNLQVQQAQTELRSAQRDFNLYLNQDGETAVPNLESLNLNVLEQLNIPFQRPGDRAEVKASEAQAKLAKASSVLAAERNKPTLDIYGAYTTYGQDSDIKKAMDESYKFEQEGTYVGLRFSVPLGLSALSDAKSGADQAVIAAEKNLNYLRFSQDQQWKDLVQKFNDAKQSLKLAIAMEKAQKAKLDNERLRLRQGRTTTYQVLLFEQDYNQAQAAKIQAASRILSLRSQSKMYQAN